VSLPAATLARVFWRCLFLQAAFNRRGMQNLGFAYAIDPALRALYPDEGARRAALERHLGFFNCHPYMAAAILGGAIHHEERVALGQEPADAVATYKATLQGPLAAVGDGFFWTALRPFFGALAAAGALALGWWAALLAVLVYNLVHLFLRVRLFRAGYRRGDEVVLAIRDLDLPGLADRLRSAAAMLCGLCVALTAWRALGLGPAAPPLVAAVAGLGWLALARRLPLLPTAYGAMLAGVGVGLWFGRWHGGP
jgi:PTS system mannose-specific IID component